ncbi:hypothetical protein [Humisphaera borealis]|uniref:Uncharacterized protein n=1 Tax=Humisphaera borealis TaxID=2807512 RepID=A0A7M2WSI7_9BACT|nr:hypothetical protein [Humisphaera borealis]QOV87550.1 hypothetical protein IPV69_14760 [Humisphaera borealis]
MKKKRSWLKRLLLGITLLLVLIAVGVATLAYMTGRSPSWYRTNVMDDKTMTRNYDSALVKLGLMQNWAQDQSNWPHRTARPRVDTDPATAPAKTQSISLTEDELNAVLWKEREKLLERYGHAIADPYIAIHEGHIVLAVTHKGTGRVVSVHVAPKIDEQGLFILSVDSLMAGSIPIPKALWSGYTDKVSGALKPALDAVRDNAAIETDGTWNQAAVVAARCRLVLSSLNGKSDDAVLFLPPDPKKLENGYPVKITQIKIENQTMSLVVIPLDFEEQQRLLLRLRAPIGESPAAPIASKADQQGNNATP